MVSSTKILVKEKIAVDLALRDSARKLFEKIEAAKTDVVILDFTSVRSISRSFAHEFITRKRASSKEVKEIHVPANVRKMFVVVESPRVKKKVYKAKVIEAVSL